MSRASKDHAVPSCHSTVRWLGVIGLAAAVALVLAPQAFASEPTGDVEAGLEVYAVTCAMCHGDDATGMMGMHPALRGALDRLSAEGVEVAIRNGRQTTPPMPAFGDELSDDQIADVIAYLETLPDGPRNFGPEMTDRDGMMRDGGMMDDDGGMMRNGGMTDRMMGGGWGWVWMLIAVLLIGVVIAAAVVISQRGKQVRRSDQRGDEDAHTILDRRYAAGELSREEYRQAREDLDR